jgi:hypothetical protein
MTSFKKYFLLALVFALLNAIFLLVFFVPRFNHTDSAQYISTIKYVLNRPDGEIILHRILNPAPIFIGVFFSFILDVKDVLIAQNIIFYFLSVILVFFLVFRIYNNEKQAFYGTVLYSTAYPMLAFGLASLTDLSGWFFYLLSIFIIFNLIKKPNLKTVFLSGLIAGIGMLFKENAAVIPIFFFSFVFLVLKLSLREKIKYLLVFGVAFICLPAINDIILYHFYSYSHYHAYRLGGFSPKNYNTFYMVSWFRIIIELVRVFFVGWVFILIGILKDIFIKNTEKIKFLIVFILPSLSVFLWSFPHNRMMYIAFPILVFWGSFGILRSYKNLKINKLIEILLISIYILSNYAMLEFFLRYGFLFLRFGEFTPVS